MSISQKSVQRPIFTIMIVLIVIILGGLALSRLPIDLMPDVSSPTISVSTSYSNASPLEMEQLVTQPIEQAVAAVPGVQDISSESSEGNSDVSVTFNWGTNLDTAANDLRDRLDRVIARLPDEASRPVLRKFDLSAMPVLTLGVTSKLDAVAVRKIIDEQVKYRIERVPGVAAMDVRGGLEREIHVNIDPQKIKALRIPLNQVINQIRAENVNLPAGNITDGSYQVTIRTPGEYKNLDELRNTIILIRGGSPIKLSDFATIDDSFLKVSRIIRINGQPGIQISVNKQSGTNTVNVAKGVIRELDNINADIPQIKIIPIIDSSVYIKRSINNVASSALIGGFLAVFIILIFLRNLKSTLIISTAIPISIIATFGLLYFNGFTLNLMTLGGLALGVGMLLDNAIVVLENIFRHTEAGKVRTEAAIFGAEEVLPPIIASTLTTVVVFLPLIFVRGMTGIMFKQLAFVVVFSMACSLLTAITLVPMLAGKLLTIKSAAEKSKSSFSKIGDFLGIFFQNVEEQYAKILHLALNHRRATTIIAVGLLLFSLILVPFIGSELMPATDEGELRINVEMEAGTKLDILSKKMNQVEKIISANIPEIKNIVSTAGGSGWGPSSSNQGSFRITVVSKTQRKKSSEEIATDMRKLLTNIPGVTIRVRTASNNMMARFLGGGGRIEIQIRGHNFSTAEGVAKKVLKAVENVDGITDANLSRTAGSPEELVVIDRPKAEELGLTVQQIAEMLETVLSGTQAGNYREAGKEYAIRVQVKDTDKLPLNEILDMSLVNSYGVPIVLRNVTRIDKSLSSTMIERLNQERMIDVSANLSGRSMSAVMKDIKTAIKDVPVPDGFSIGFGGDYAEQQKAFKELMVGFILSLILVYMVMACQYESLRDPFVVMFSVPLAAIGVILMLFLTGTTFNIQSYIGCIMLGGIVVNNAILLVDTTNLLRRRDGMPTRSAIEEAGRRRLRPILMTALATVLGLIPMAIGMGEGGEAQSPLARAVVGGLLSSTLITLIFIPVVYSFFEEGFHKIKS
jgi:hydrophobic/amphiphilic exporter-1 (mainly G- bacteria), HAE1 family